MREETLSPKYIRPYAITYYHLMDPFSLATGTVGLVVFCAQLSEYINAVKKKLQSLDHEICILGIEIESLSNVLRTIREKSSNWSAAATNVEPSLAGSEADYWKTVDQSMKDCKKTLENLQTILQYIKDGENRKFLPRRYSLQARLDQKSEEIDWHKRQIVVYRQTLDVYLQLLILYILPLSNSTHFSSSQLRSETVNRNLEIRLGELTIHIESLLRKEFSHTGQSVEAANNSPMNTLEQCVRSADTFVTTARSVIGSRSTILSEQQRSDLYLWIPEPLSPEMSIVPTETSPLPQEDATSPTTQTSYDLEPGKIQSLQKLAFQKYNAHEWGEAKKKLERLLKRCTGKYEASSEQRNKVWEMLLVTYCRLEDWENAERITHTDTFDGREEAIKLLMLCYFQSGKWDDAERLVIEMLDKSYETETVWKLLTLAEIYLQKREFQKAINHCQVALEEISSTEGEAMKENVLFHLTISLFVRIHEAEDDMDEAELLKEDLPPEIQGTVLFPTSLIKVCEQIEKISRMWPDQAAEEAERTWSACFSEIIDLVPWNEIRNNIKNGHVIGSGNGYTLLHAFVEQGNALAVGFLLHKGTDVDAKTKSNADTALHLAVQSQNTDMVKLLLKNRADPLVRDSNGMTPLGHAIIQGSDDILKSLLASQGVNILASEGKAPFTPLMLAIKYGKEKTVELLVVEYKANIEAKDENGNTALLRAVENKPNPKIVEILLKAEANVNASNNHRLTPLMLAVKCGSEKVVGLLLSKNPDIEAKAYNGASFETALLIAAKNGFNSIVQSLLDCGAECVGGYPRGGTPEDVAKQIPVKIILQKARMRKKKWYQRVLVDDYTIAEQVQTRSRPKISMDLMKG